MQPEVANPVLLDSINEILSEPLFGRDHAELTPRVANEAFPRAEPKGSSLILEHALGGRFKVPAWLRWFVTFQLIVFGWIIFRSQSVSELWAFLRRFGSPGAPTLWTAPVIIAILVTIVPQLLPEHPFDRLQGALGRLNPVLLGGALGVLILFVAATVASQGVPPFIYFRF